MKKILFVILVTVMPVTIWAQLDTINIGTSANSGTGESLRSAMIKTNNAIDLLNNIQLYNISAAEMAVLNGVPATLTATELGYVDGVTSAIQTQLDAKQATLVSGTNIKTINSLDVLGSGDLVVGAGGTMDYPGAGIALSSGSSWTTSITNNSANWNTAYGWGNHASAGYATLASPTFTGTVVLPAATSIGNVSATELGYLDNVTSAIQTQFTGKVSVSDTSSMLTPYATSGEVALKANLASPTFTGTVTVPQPFTIGATSMTATATELNVLDGIAASLTYTELNYVDGVTSAIQTQLNAKIGTSDTASMLAPYLLTSELTSQEARIDSIVTVLGDTTNIETLMQIDFDTDTLADLSDVRASIADSLNALRNNSEELSDFAVMLADTVPLFVFGLGSGIASDTTVFKDNAIAGAFFNAGSDTLAVTSIRGVMAEGSGTETISVQVSWHATFKSGSATNLNTSALAITSITTGTVDTSFANSKIPPGVFVWCTLSGTSAGNKPSLLILTMAGYKIPTY